MPPRKAHDANQRKRWHAFLDEALKAKRITRRDRALLAQLSDLSPNAYPHVELTGWTETNGPTRCSVRINF